MHPSSKHLLGTLAAMSLLSLPLLAQPRSIKPYLPESTVMVVSASDIGASLREMHEMPLAKMWAEDEVQDFVADLLKMAHEYMEQGLDQARAANEQGMLPISTTPGDRMTSGR